MVDVGALVQAAVGKHLLEGLEQEQGLEDPELGGRAEVLLVEDGPAQVARHDVGHVHGLVGELGVGLDVHAGGADDHDAEQQHVGRLLRRESGAVQDGQLGVEVYPVERDVGLHHVEAERVAVVLGVWARDDALGEGGLDLGEAVDHVEDRLALLVREQGFLGRAGRSDGVDVHGVGVERGAEEGGGVVGVVVGVGVVRVRVVLVMREVGGGLVVGVVVRMVRVVVVVVGGDGAGVLVLGQGGGDGGPRGAAHVLSQLAVVGLRVGGHEQLEQVAGHAGHVGPLRGAAVGFAEDGDGVLQRHGIQVHGRGHGDGHGVQRHGGGGSGVAGVAGGGGGGVAQVRVGRLRQREGRIGGIQRTGGASKRRKRSGGGGGGGGGG